MTTSPTATATATPSFRDRIPTADAKGKRIWVYPRKPKGRFYNARNWVSLVLLGILVSGPFIRIGGNPLLMMNVLERKFVLFGQIFWPQDFYIFALALLTIFIMIVLFTAVFGRVWCGWLCPQTVLMEMVFRKIEYWIEGDAREQRALHDAPWGASKLAKKTFKHVVFFALSFAIGNLLLAYIIGSDNLRHLITDDPRQHMPGLAAMTIFSLIFYGIFARFREQACTFICPYGRFQSVLLDEHSIVVSYDYRRGEPQQRFSKNLPYPERKKAGVGDCINCRLCVDVCPTGIDIRNGTQMECVNCTACIDACDGVMDRLTFPRGLIRYASQNGIAQGERLRITPRIAGYCTVLTILAGLLVFILSTRTDVETQILRTPGTLYQVMPNDEISNLLLVKVVNKTSRPIPVDLRLDEPAGGRLQIAGTTLVAPPQGLAQSAVIITLPRSLMTGANLPLTISVYEEGRRLKTIHSNFVGPGTGT